MRIRSFLWLVGILCICYSTLTLMVTTLKPILGSVEKYSTEKKQVILRMQRERAFYKRQAQQIQEFVAHDDDILAWNRVRDDYDLHQLPSINATTNGDKHNNNNININYHLIQSDNLCKLSQAFQRYRDSVLFTPSPHVLWWRDSAIDSRDPAQEWQNDGCSTLDLKEYLNHEDTLAVMITSNSTAVRILKHDKLFPMTKGVWQDKSDSLRQQLWTQIMDQTKKRNRTTPVLIVGDKVRSTRLKEIKDRMIHVFGPGGVKAMLIPRPEEDHQVLYENLVQAQFVIGLTAGGNHDWVNEALVLGAIPILEDDNERNANYKNMYHKQLYEKLPVSWIDDYENLTPEVIEIEMQNVLQHLESFQFERLTQIYWIYRAFELWKEQEAQRKKEEEELARLEAKKEQDKKKGKKIFRIPTN